MNCEELNTQIKELEEEFKDISEQVEEFSRSEGVEKKELQALDRKIVELEAKRDAVLGVNLDEFVERWPELRDLPFCVDVPRFKSKNGAEVWISSEERLSDTEILVQASNGEMNILAKRDGKWEYENIPDFRDRDGNSIGVCWQMVCFGGERIFVLGDHGRKAGVLAKRDGRWMYEDVPEFRNENGDVEDINYAESLLGDEILVKGYYKTRRYLIKVGDKWEYRDAPKVRDENGDEIKISEIFTLSDTDVFVVDDAAGDDDLKIRILTKIDGEWSCEKVPEFETEDGEGIRAIEEVVPLSGTEVFFWVKQGHGASKILTKTDDGWEYKDAPQIRDEDGNEVDIRGVEHWSDKIAFIDFEQGGKLLVKNDDGEWVFEDFPEFNGKEGEETEAIHYVAGLSETEIFVQDLTSPKILRKVNGKWVYVDVLGLDESDGWFATRVSDTEVFIRTRKVKGGGKILECPKMDLEMLKRNIGKIERREK